eukprot:COSAG01_NODE_64230_length_277_cov_0.842697_1_plen_67_part_10
MRPGDVPLRQWLQDESWCALDPQIKLRKAADAKQVPRRPPLPRACRCGEVGGFPWKLLIESRGLTRF